MSTAACFVLSGLALLPIAARGDTFSFSSSGGGMSFNGALDTVSNGDGSYTITGVSGSGIGGIATSPFFPSDNLLFPGRPRILDVLGFGFTTTISGVSDVVNLYSDNSPAGFSYFADVYDPTGNLIAESTVSFAVTAATPEPSSWLLLGTGGMLILASAVRRRVAA